MAMPPPTAIAPAPLGVPALHGAAGSTQQQKIAQSPLTPTAAAAAPPVLDDRLPQFATREVQLNKVDNRNALVFSVPKGSSLLLKLVKPPCHAYEKRDLRWLHLLQAIAVVPSRHVDTIAKLALQALQLMRSPQYKQRLELALRGLAEALTKEGSTLSFSQRALLALRLKDHAARFIREWVKDPVEGFVLRKDHVVGGMRLDDLVATPVGAGYLRGYRREDRCCVVVYPWGHGFIHRSKVEKLEEAIDHERKKRHHNEYLALEHQQLFEQVESLLENYPPEQTAGDDGDNATSPARDAVAPDGVDLDQYRELLAELQTENFDLEIIQHDLSFVRRVQALSNKLHKRQRTQSMSREHEEDEAEACMREKPAVHDGVKTERLSPTEDMDTEEQKEEEKEEEEEADYGPDHVAAADDDDDDEEEEDEPMKSDPEDD